MVSLMMKLMVIYFIIKLFAQINYLKRTNFCVDLLSRAKKKSYFASTYFREWQIF